MKHALTARKVETAAPHKTRREIPDAYLPGLYLVIQSGGAKSWAVRYRQGKQGKQTHKHTLGPYPRLSLKAARELGAEALRMVAEGRDPAQEKREARTAEPNDIESVLKDFLQKHTRKKNGDPVRESTRRERARLFGLKRDSNDWIKTGNGVLKRWKGRTIDSITKNDVRDLIGDVPGKVLPNRTLDVLKTFFTWCVKNDRLAKSPCDKIEPPCPKTSGERILSTDELRMVWRAAQTMGPPFGSLVQLLMLTGQRRNEVANMEWQELDIENQLWSLPPERVKNNKRHEVPLSPQAVAVIEQVPRIGNRFVLTTNGTGPASDFGKKKRQLDALLPDMKPWNLHDLRRTTVSGMAALGISLPVTEKVINHISGSFSGIVSVYQKHDFAKEKRHALEAWGNHIAGLEDTTKVINLRR